jgi:uncharacterized protein
MAPLSIAHAQTLAPHTITVAGAATIKAAPDTALVTVNLNSTGQTSQAALQADKAALARLVEAVRPLHVATSDVQTSNINIMQVRSMPRLPAQDPVLPGSYQVTDHLTVTVDDLSKVGAVIDAVAQAAGNTSVNVQFNLKDRSAAEDKAKVEAIADARRQAGILAAAEGAKVDKMIAISTIDPGNPLQPYLNLIAATSNQQGQVSVTERVMVQYGLQ